MNTTTMGQSGPGSNGNEGLIQIPQCSRTDVLPSDEARKNIIQS